MCNTDVNDMHSEMMLVVGAFTALPDEVSNDLIAADTHNRAATLLLYQLLKTKRHNIKGRIGKHSVCPDVRQQTVWSGVLRLTGRSLSRQTDTVTETSCK